MTYFPWDFWLFCFWLTFLIISPLAIPILSFILPGMYIYYKYREWEELVPDWLRSKQRWHFRCTVIGYFLLIPSFAIITAPLISALLVFVVSVVAPVILLFRMCLLICFKRDDSNNRVHLSEIYGILGYKYPSDISNEVQLSEQGSLPRRNTVESGR